MRVKTAERTALRGYVIGHFSLADLKTLAADLGLDYDRIPHTTTDELALELIRWCERQGRDAVAGLIRAVIAERPAARAQFGPWLQDLPVSDAPPDLDSDAPDHSRPVTIHTGDIIMGDQFRNITGSTIINRSMLQNSLNTVRATRDEATAQALAQVGAAVEQSGNLAAGALFDQFNAEAQKPAPDKSKLRSFWDGLVAVLPSIAGLADAGLKIAQLFAPGP